jgi:DNA-binding NtrC family response regulator
MSDDRIAQLDPPALLGPSTAREDLRVLVVDDDPTSLQLVVTLVRSLGFAVETAGNGQDGLARFEATQPQLVISDLMMPILDGAGLLAWIKELNPSVPVMIMSVLDSVDQAVKLLKSGADDYLSKPVSRQVLETKLDALVERLLIRRDVEELRELIRSAFELGEGFIVGPSSAMLQVVAKIPTMARTDATIVIYGESGTGKELVARAIHHASRRAKGPMISFSCASVPDGLWERELFGHVKGAFSDAGDGGPGVVETAHGGTLFLDEVGEIPLAMQAKLLRFLQEKEYRPVGSVKPKHADVRLVSATHRDLEAMVAREEFRQDLYYRLNVIPLRMPALRERKEDIPLLAAHFLRRYASSFDKPVVGFSPLALQKLASYDFPGNVRELENAVQQSLIATRYTVICADDIPVGDANLSELKPQELAEPPPAIAAVRSGEQVLPDAAGVDLALPYNEAKERAVKHFERSYVEALLERNSGNVSRAARDAGLPRKSLSRIMARHDIGGGPDGEGGRPGRPRSGR